MSKRDTIFVYMLAISSIIIVVLILAVLYLIVPS